MQGRRKDIIEWDVPNWSVALRFWKQKTRVELSGARALEIGARCGGLSLWGALSGMSVLCTDIDGPSEAAYEKHRRYGVDSLIEYGKVDAREIPYSNAFDVVLFKSVLGGIGQCGRIDYQRRAVAQIYEALKPGGELWFAENLVSSPFHRAFRTTCVSWGKIWRYVTMEEMLMFLSEFAQVQYTTVGFLGTFGRTPVLNRILGRIDRSGFDRLVPACWRYIIIGIASK